MNKKEKYINLFESFLYRFLVIILGVGMIINVMMPDRKESLAENRTLQTFPSMTWDAIKDGTFANDVNQWFSDQFIGRDQFIYIRYLMQKWSGQKEINGIYLTSKGLIEEIKMPMIDEEIRNIDAINDLFKRTKVKTYFLLAPNNATINKSSLPWFYDGIDQKEQIEDIYDYLDVGITTVDVTKKLEEHKSEYLYYKSDHHWTSLAAYYALESLASTMNLGEVKKENYKVYPVTTSFQGTLSQSVGSLGYKDQIDIYVPEGDMEYLFINEGNGSKSGTIFVSSALEKKDKYSVFMGGNTSLCRLEMNNPTSSKHLLIIKDSYANCLIPMLIPYYRTITIVDPRYYYDDLTRLINGDSITEILYLYNGNTFSQDRSIADMIENSLH